jgi:hypothetical protein
MGERGAKRRAAVRDAVRAADERFATGTHQMVQLPQAQQPTVHEAVSEIVLTKMNSGVNNELLGDRPTGATPPTTQAPLSNPGSYTTSTPPEQHSSTDQPVVTAQEMAALRKSRSGLFAGLGAVAVAAIIVAVVMLRSGGTSAQSGQPLPPPKPSAVTPVVTVASTTPAPPPPVTSASASASSNAISPANLPDAEAQPQKPVTNSGTHTPVVQNTAAPKPSSDPGKPTPKVNTGNVPVFTNPGF